jgi:2-polyprenyl-6-hydroxyphenyl methylase/3-demethylubiquinone-9 3-methyltransferase
MSRMKSELYFEEIGENFNRWMSAYDVGRRIELIRGLLPANARESTTLELGCGTGAITDDIAPRVGPLTVTDYSERLSRETGERLGAAWSRQDACAITLADESFDLVFSSECIEHTPDPRKALREMARVTRKGGTLIVTSPNRLWYPVLLLSMALKIRKFAGNELWLYPSEAARTLEECGMRDVRVTGCHLFPWQLPLARTVLPFFDRFGSTLHPLMINWGVRATKPPA